MNTKRKAELQRKLSIASVPKPPADLASRIKQGIPRSIGVSRPAANSWGSASMRIAASLIVVVASAYFAVRLLSRAPSTEGRDATSMAARAARSIDQSKPEGALPATEPAATGAPAESRQAPNAAPASAFAPEQAAAKLEKDQKEMVADRAQAPKTSAAAPSANFVAEAAPTRRDFDAPAPPPPLPPAVVATAAARPAAEAVVQRPASAPAMQTTVVAQAPAVADDRVERALQPSAGSAVGGIAGVVASRTGHSDAESKKALRQPAIAVTPTAIAPSMFGISTDPVAMEIVRTAVQRGEDPPVVNVEAIVNYFASAADEPPRRMSLQVEGSPPPVMATPRTRVVRVTIDTPWSDAADAPVAATEANLTISFDNRAVASQRLIGGTASLSASQRIVLKNASVTALYEIQLQPGLSSRQKVVTARLTYRDGSTGRDQALTAQLRVGDVDRAWLDASRRHRLATLGAIWGESLKGSLGGADVARRAEELANQEPRDRKAHELAQLATASSRRRNSGPTGSGR
jgi:hypothetical protein